MQLMIRTSNYVCRALALTVMFGAGVAAMSAQQAVSSTSDAPADAQPRPALNLQAPSSFAAAEPLFSSSAAENEVAVNTEHFNFVDAMQYGGRQRYGRPRYRGNNTNADGSNKYVFMVGGGFTQPLGNTYHYLTPSWGLQGGGGRQFNKNFAVLAQFDWDNFGFNGRTLGNQLNLYNAVGSDLDSLDGSSHIWSFTVNPTYTFYSGEGLGAYVVAGVGFYHKVATFTTPAIGEYCDPYYGCEEYEANEPIDHYTSNAPGFNGGFGLTYKFSHFSNERLYGEVRYVFVDNSQRQGVTVFNLSSSNYELANYYPANSNRTTYLPVKFGLRF